MSKDKKLDINRLRLKIYEGNKFPQELLDLRREVYVDEMEYLSEETLVSSNDSGGLHILLYYGKALIAAAHAIEAELSDFPAYSGIRPEDLSGCVYVSRQMVKKEFRGMGLSKLMIYIEAREFRMRGKETIIVYMTPGEEPNRKILQMVDMAGALPREVQDKNGKSYMVYGAGQDIPYGALRCWNMMSSELKTWVADNLIADEAIRTVEAKIAAFYDNPWFHRVKMRSLTRRQYLTTLGNWHQFVRWTTKILARVISITKDDELRKHYVDHLQGELDHEKWIEKDISHIEGDVPYVVNDMAPIKEIRIFMALQESLVSFYQDPIVFLGVPFAIEGLSGKLPPEFTTALRDNVKKWGYKSPSKATRFLSSHVHTDGAPDGHWEKTKKMIRKHLRNERDLQNFLVTADIVVTTINAAFEQFVATPDFTQIGPTER